MQASGRPNESRTEVVVPGFGCSRVAGRFRQRNRTNLSRTTQSGTQLSDLHLHLTQSASRTNAKQAQVKDLFHANLHPGSLLLRFGKCSTCMSIPAISFYILSRRLPASYPLLSLYITQVGYLSTATPSIKYYSQLSPYTVTTIAPSHCAADRCTLAYFLSSTSVMLMGLKRSAPA